MAECGGVEGGVCGGSSVIACGVTVTSRGGDTVTSREGVTVTSCEGFTEDSVGFTAAAAGFIAAAAGFTDVLTTGLALTFSDALTTILESICERGAAGLRKRLDSSGRGASAETVGEKEKGFLGTKGVLLLDLSFTTRNTHPTRRKAGSSGRTLPSSPSHAPDAAHPHSDSRT